MHRRSLLHVGCTALRVSDRIPYGSLPISKRCASTSTPLTSSSTCIFVVPKVPDPTLSVLGSDQRFPVRRIYCVGQNYRAHALEMGSNPDRSPPFFFTKPRDAAVDTSGTGAKIPYPSQTEDLHHEVELVVAIGQGGRGIRSDVALKHVFGYGVGVDLTRRDMQAAAKKAGKPWDCSKGFDSSAPVGMLTPARQMILEAGFETGFEKRSICLEVDGVVRQESVLGDMIWTIPEMISGLSELFTLEPGDVLFTGTPAGVSALEVGNAVEAKVEGLESCCFEVAPSLPPTSRGV